MYNYFYTISLIITLTFTFALFHNKLIRFDAIINVHNGVNDRLAKLVTWKTQAAPHATTASVTWSSHVAGPGRASTSDCNLILVLLQNYNTERESYVMLQRGNTADGMCVWMLWGVKTVNNHMLRLITTSFIKYWVLLSLLHFNLQYTLKFHSNCIRY